MPRWKFFRMTEFTQTVILFMKFPVVRETAQAVTDNLDRGIKVSGIQVLLSRGYTAVCLLNGYEIQQKIVALVKGVKFFSLNCGSFAVGISQAAEKTHDQIVTLHRRRRNFSAASRCQIEQDRKQKKKTAHTGSLENLILYLL